MSKKFKKKSRIKHIKKLSHKTYLKSHTNNKFTKTTQMGYLVVFQ